MIHPQPYQGVHYHTGVKCSVCCNGNTVEKPVSSIVKACFVKYFLFTFHALTLLRNCPEGFDTPQNMQMSSQALSCREGKYSVISLQLHLPQL